MNKIIFVIIIFSIFYSCSDKREKIVDILDTNNGLADRKVFHNDTLVNHTTYWRDEQTKKDEFLFSYIDGDTLLEERFYSHIGELRLIRNFKNGILEGEESNFKNKKKFFSTEYINGISLKEISYDNGHPVSIITKVKKDETINSIIIFDTNEVIVDSESIYINYLVDTLRNVLKLKFHTYEDYDSVVAKVYTGKLPDFSFFRIKEDDLSQKKRIDEFINLKFDKSSFLDHYCTVVAVAYRVEDGHEFFYRSSIIQIDNRDLFHQLNTNIIL